MSLRFSRDDLLIGNSPLYKEGNKALLCRPRSHIALTVEKAMRRRGCVIVLNNSYTSLIPPF